MKILVAYDGSASADTAIEDLRRAGLPAQAEALIVCVDDGGLPAPEGVNPVEAGSHDSWRARLAEAEMLAEKASRRIVSCFPRWTVSSKALWGSPAKIILDTSGSWRPDLLVVGSHGRSLVGRLFLGSVSSELVHKAACSVRVARSGGSFTVGGPIRIIVGNDGSTEAEAVVQAVLKRSWPEKTEAQIISVVQTLAPAADPLDASTFAQEPAFTVIHDVDEHERARLQKVAEETADVLRGAGLIPTRIVVDGDPRMVILAEAERWNADAIFVGARGLGRMERLLLGSVSTHVVTHARCTVEVARQQS